MRCRNKYCHGSMITDGERGLYCMLCGRTFAQTEDRQQSLPPEPTSPIVCPECGTIIRHERGLGQHRSYCEAKRDLTEASKNTGWRILYRNPEFVRNRSSNRGREVAVEVSA